MKAPWPYPRIIAHRGGGSLAPENTLAALRCGRGHGYRAVEIDVKLTSDGIAVLMHDATLERTTNGTGPVKARTWQELSRLDAGAWHSPAFRGEPVAGFEAVAHFLRESGMCVNVEIKPNPGDEAVTGERVAELCAQYWQGAEVLPLLSSFSVVSLEAAQRARTQLPRALLMDHPGPGDLARLAALGCASINCDHAGLDPGGIALFQDAGYRVLAYTVNDPERAQLLFDWGVDGVFTDSLATFAARFPALIR
jgi:glycerophosphoryl diester phosphodiesterase